MIFTASPRVEALEKLAGVSERFTGASPRMEGWNYSLVKLNDSPLRLEDSPETLEEGLAHVLAQMNSLSENRSALEIAGLGGANSFL